MEARRQHRIKVAVVDDHELIIRGWKDVFRDHDKYELVFTALSGREFMTGMGRHRDVELAIVDMRMPGMDGLQVIQWLRAQWPNVRCAALSFDEDPDVIRRAINGGASCYMIKGRSTSECIEELDLMMSKGLHHSEIVRAAMAGADREAITLARLGISTRRMEYLKWICHPRDYTYDQIAEFMHVGRSAVDGYARYFGDRFGLHTRSAIAKWARDQGLFQNLEMN